MAQKRFYIVLFLVHITSFELGTLPLQHFELQLSLCQLALATVSIGSCHSINWQLSQYQLAFVTTSISSCHNINWQYSQYQLALVTISIGSCQNINW